MKHMLKHNSFGLILALAIAAGLPARLAAQNQDASSETSQSDNRTNYVSPFILGLALNLGVYTPFAELGSIVFVPQLRLTSEFFLGAGENPPDCSMTLSLGLDMVQYVFVEIGLEWNRAEGIPLDAPFGIFISSGINAETVIGNITIGFRWRTLASSRLLKNGETLLVSFLSPVTSASLSVDALENGLAPSSSGIVSESETGGNVPEFASNLGISMDIASVGIGFNPYSDARKIRESADRASGKVEPGISFFYGTGLHMLPLMYFFMPLPFTEISAGMEINADTSSFAVTLHYNWLMTIADFYEALSLELTYCPIKTGNWRPGVTVGMDLSKLAIILLADPGYDLFEVFYAGLDLLCFDYVLRDETRIRFSVFPLNSNSVTLLMGAPHVLTLMRAYWFF